MAPHSSTLAWKIPWMEEPGGLQSHALTRLSDFTFAFHFPALAGRFFIISSTWEAHLLLLLLSHFSCVRLSATP